MSSQIKDLPCITPLILKNLGINNGSIKTLLSSYVEQGVFTKLKRGCYINSRVSYSLHTRPGLLFPESYITLDTVLYEMGVIRQASRTLYSISMRGSYEEIVVENQHL